MRTARDGHVDVPLTSGFAGTCGSVSQGVELADFPGVPRAWKTKHVQRSELASRALSGGFLLRLPRVAGSP